VTRILTFLRSLIWTSVLSVVSAVVAILLALTNFNPTLPITLAISAVALAILSKD
jgi:hypothetical protein